MELNRNPFRIPAIACAAVTLFVTSCVDSESPERLLKRLGLEYETDAEGDYKAEVVLPDGRTKTVGIGAHGIPLRDGLSLREIWSVAVRIPGSLPDGLAESLLTDTWSSAMFGAWALAGETVDGRQVLVYVCRLPMDATESSFSAALVDAATAASDMEAALAGLAD